MRAGSAVRQLSLAVLAVFLVAATPAGASHVPIEVLLSRLFTEPAPVPYELTASFSGGVLVTWRGPQLTAQATGNFREWRAVHGGPKRREVTITTLEVPVLLRPLTPALKDLIKDRLEREGADQSLPGEYDLFIVDELPGERYILGGIRADIVTEIMRKYGRGLDLKDAAVRREVARWLYQPRQREMILRSGSPYLVMLLIDENGTYYRVLLQYDWGPVESQFEWASVNGQLLVRELKADASSDVRGFGHVTARLNLRFSNHCYNCRR